MRKFNGLLVVLCAVLALSGCYEQMAGNAQDADGFGLMVAAERHDITVSVAKPNLAATVANHAGECVQPSCLVLSKWTQADDFTTRGDMKMLVADSGLDALLNRLSTTPAKVSAHKIRSGGPQTAPDLDARLAALVSLRDSLQKHMVASPLSPLESAAAERRLARLQGDIETIAFLQKNSGALALAGDAGEDGVPTSLAYVHVVYDTLQGSGLDMAPVHKSIGSAKQMVVNSTAAMIGFAALALPWLPVAVIVMWLLSIVFKSRVKVKTVPSAPVSGPVVNYSTAAPKTAAPAVAPAAPAADPKPAAADAKPAKKKLLGGLLGK